MSFVLKSIFFLKKIIIYIFLFELNILKNFHYIKHKTQLINFRYIILIELEPLQHIVFIYNMDSLSDANELSLHFNFFYA